MADKDIRISTSLFTHPKWVRLGRRCGHEGQLALIRLWCWARDHRCDGDLHDMDDRDVEEIAAGWKGDAGALVEALVDVRLLDREEGGLRIHDWPHHNGFAAGSAARSAAARNAAILRARTRTNTPLNREVWEWLSASKQRKYWKLAPPEVRGGATTYAEFCQRQRQRQLPNPANGTAPSPSPPPSPTPLEGGGGRGDSASDQPLAGSAAASPGDNHRATAARRGMCVRCAASGSEVQATIGPGTENGYRPDGLDMALCAGHLTEWYAEQRECES